MAKTTPNKREARRAAQRAELIAAAHVLVREGGFEGLSIRKLAHRVGYAPMSVYSYFTDKHEILVALARDAFETLARNIEEHAPEDPIEGLQAALAEYAAFGIDNPNEYRIIFMTPYEGPLSPEQVAERRARNPAMRVLIARVEACVRAGSLHGDAGAIATLLWTTAHGAISLIISLPQLPVGEPHAYVGKVCDLMLSALARQEIAPLA